MATVSIQRASLHSSDVQALISALNAELSERYPEEGAVFSRLDTGEVSPGKGAILIAVVDSEAVGCGAIRRVDESDAEIKRMYVVPGFRGTGVGRALLNGLEVEAHLLGVSRLVLETGERLPEALVLYERAGFAVIPQFGEYLGAPLSLCVGKLLR